MKQKLILTVVCLLLAVPSGVLSQTALPGLHAAAKILRDVDGIPHIIAQNEHDMIMMQGWVHAQDRLFQMDLSRRQASGTLAEVLGSAALGEDVQFRTFGLRRAAERSLAALSPEVQMTLDAYADGVNAWVARHPLPPEYGILEITQFEPWTALDTIAVTKLLAFGLSFDLDIGFTEVLLTYQAAGTALGFDGTALFFEDLFRSAPFDPASTVPDAMEGAMAPTAEIAPAPALQATVPREWNAPDLRQETLDLARTYIESIRGLPILERALDPNRDFEGSNEWAVSGPLTDNGRPLVANDPHLALNTPSTFYQIHLRAISDGFDVIGSGFPGAAYVVIGQNRKITWGATVNPMDVTDVYQEIIVPDPSSPSGLSTVYLGSPEPIIPIPVVFRFNQIDDGVPDNIAIAPPGGGIPPFVLIVPRRNNGPILALDLAAGVGISLQYTGFSATREADTFRAWNIAQNLDDFIDGLQYFDFGSQNWVYGDVSGNIAYFTSAEMPVREDLQAGFIDGLPPYFIRNGTGGNEWLPVMNPQPGQATPYEILPFDEMPKLINPPAGYFVNANNDPTGNTLDNDVFNQLRPGGGIFYLNPGYAIGTRAGRITEALEQRLAAGPVTPEDMEAVQADVVMLDAQVFTPYILEAFENANEAGANPALAALAADPRLVEAMGRLAGWDRTAPTGLDEGYDASDFDGVPSPPGTAEIEASVAATIYSVWRGQMIGNTIDATLGLYGLPGPGSSQAMTALRNLLDTFDTNDGVGASGLNFFNVPGVSEADSRRDIILLQSMIDALDLLAGPAFDAAFDGSTDQNDYRWGRLHRIVLDHPLGGPFDVPPAGGAFPPPLDDLDGIPVDGGFGVPDASSHSARADSSEDFRFGSGPARRYVGQVVRSPLRIEGRTALPGGESGVLGSPYYVNLLGRWLTNDAYGMRHRMKDVQQNTAEREVFVPAKKRRRGPPVTR
ncbi:MAG: penicillin acylase family protein [Thermoanaerobaculia bacterium]